jgi:thiosulfate/3-mercaptopyruvate sulfurtransferase
VSELKANPGKYLIIDCRPLVLYQKGHIPGAINVDWTRFVDMTGHPGDPGWADVPDKAKLSRTLGSLGIDGKRPLVAYADRGGWGPDGWAVWIARVTGDKKARMLDGGFMGWLDAGGTAYKAASAPKPVKVSVSKLDMEGWDVTCKWLAANLSRVKVLDVRTTMEYNGARYFQERRGGHIPGAVNLPFDSFYRNDGTVRDAAEVQAALAPLGIVPGDDLVVYDTSGVRGAFATMVLRMSGFPTARNFDGGFQEWAGTKELEVAGGK